MDDCILVIVDDVVSNIQPQDAASACSSSSAVYVGMDGVMRLQNGELSVVEVGALETKDAGRYGITGDAKPTPPREWAYAVTA